MTTFGPIPKRSDERIRRNEPEVPIDKIQTIGIVPIPDLNIANPHPMVVDMYQALRDSAQSRYYEPSDWEFARLTMYVINDMLNKNDIGAMKLSAVNQMFTSLLMTEGDRRRARIEIERKTGNQPQGKVLQAADMFKQRLGAT